ncbi:MAG: OPT/YSL family transporter [Phycisphaeraceae bacterium]|nr:MAG: OPT/YSL family transporter [Phycisphaeraceae bacterium]
MAIPHLTDEQIRDWSLEQKDRWWLENVFRGDMPQLTIRSAIMGFFLGGFLSATNLYIGAKTGWSLGVGITSVILAFSFFKILQRSHLANEFTILENNCVQSIATAAGYMTSPLISSLVAYMLIDGRLLPWWQMLTWNIVVSILGVLFAFPLKRRFINDEQHPFPEGRACGVVMDALHSAEGAAGVIKARILLVTALAAGFIKFLQSGAIQQWVQAHLLGLHAAEYGALKDAKGEVKAIDQQIQAATDAGLGVTAQLHAQMSDAVTHLREAYTNLEAKIWALPEALGDTIAMLFAKLGLKAPAIGGIDARQLTLDPALDIALMGAGGLMGIRAGLSLLLGGLINYAVLAPIMIHQGAILPAAGSLAGGDAVFGFRPITTWALWPGVACMVAASFTSLLAKPQAFLAAFGAIFGKKKKKGADVLGHIELPFSVSLIGVPILSVIAAFMAKAYFGVEVWVCLVGLPLAFILALVAASSTALTGTTPVGATSKVTQLFYGLISPGQTTTNVATASLTAETVSNASNLLMDIKPGYMLGAKPRQQAIGHVIGIIAGSIASVPLFFILFIKGNSAIDTSTVEATAATLGNIQNNQFPMPSATVWKAVAEALTHGLSGLHPSVLYAVIIGGLLGLFLEFGRVFTKGKMPLSPIALGLAFVINFESIFAMSAGAIIFWLLGVGRTKSDPEMPDNLWVENHEPICAGIIAGAALMGILDAVVASFVL